jgi:hypothetical protein
MGPATERVYRPDPERALAYDRLFEDYRRLGAFVEAYLTR